MDSLIRDTAERLFRDLQDSPDQLWAAMQDNGFTRAWSPEALGGTGLSVTDGFELIRIAATINCGVPFAETMLASYLLSSAGLETPDGRFSLIIEDDTQGSVIQFAETAKFVARLNNGQAEYFNIEKAVAIDNIGYDSAATVNLSNAQPVASAPAPNWMMPEVWQQLGALTRSAQICGAMSFILELCLEHTSTREQFGRPLSKFQAIQHLLAEIAGETAASTAALQAAVHSASLDGAPDFIAVASAKARASEAAGIVAAHAIQTHGAIGYTEEYGLARFVRRLWQWREDFGNASHWQLRLGEYYARTESAGLTPDIFGSTHS